MGLRGGEVELFFLRVAASFILKTVVVEFIIFTEDDRYGAIFRFKMQIVPSARVFRMRVEPLCPEKKEHPSGDAPAGPEKDERLQEADDREAETAFFLLDL
jgi:hypothetical protein